MSTCLYAVYSAPEPAAVDESDLRRFVVDRCAGKVLNNALQGFRVNVTTERQETLVEPFIACASFCALVRQKKKRAMILLLLQAMCDWAAAQNIPVHLLIVASRPRQEDRSVRFESVEQFAQSF